jgi:hypothetical protein
MIEGDKNSKYKIDKNTKNHTQNTTTTRNLKLSQVPKIPDTRLSESFPVNNFTHRENAVS